MRNIDEPWDAFIFVFIVFAASIIFLGGVLRGWFPVMGGIALFADGFIIGNKVK